MDATVGYLRESLIKLATKATTLMPQTQSAIGHIASYSLTTLTSALATAISRKQIDKFEKAGSVD